MALISVNPATGRRLRSYPALSARGMEIAVERSHRSFLAWRELAFSDRSRHFRKLAMRLKEKAQPLAGLITREMGKPIQQSVEEVLKCSDGCRAYADRAEAYLADEKPLGASRRARVAYEPLGPILAVMPWNFPFWQVFRAAAPALMAGNTLLLKHSANVSGCSLAIADLFQESGFPKGVFQSLLISNSQVAGLVGDDRIRGVTLTGSTQAGRKVASLAGASLKKGVFELGGSDPYLILEDADIEHAAEVCAKSRLINSGQSCICGKRFIVVESVRLRFEKAFVRHMAAHRTGDPSDPQTQVGPLARSDLRDELHRQVTASVRQGARVLLGGLPGPGSGFFYLPTVLSGVRKGMPAHGEELFGPVAAVISARDAQAAVRIANDSRFGLGAAVFSRDTIKAEEIARQIEAGTVAINDLVRSDPSLPFGGVKDSGYGRELGCHGIREFVNTKTLWLG